VRSAAYVVPALVALGLWASLLPQVTYASATSGAPSGNVLVAWPGWGVQQDLGSIGGAVERLQIWTSAEPERGVATVWASLVDTSTSEVLRQTTIDVSPAYTPVARTLNFPGYRVPDGQQVSLLLQVATFETRYVVVGLARPSANFANVALNGAADAGIGPLAFAHVQTGNGLRAAILGEQSGRIRLILAGIIGLLAVLAHPRITGQVGRVTHALQTRGGALVKRAQAKAKTGARTDSAEASGTAIRLLAIPWFPWLAVAVPILHFAATNDVHFDARETAIPLVAALTFVSVSVTLLRALGANWNVAAAAIAIVIVVFFSYGHIDHAFDGRVDERALVAVVIVVGVAAVALVLRSANLIGSWVPFLNLTAAIVLLFPTASLLSSAGTLLSQTSDSNSESVDNLIHHLLPDGVSSESRTRPDVYYIILDSYGRSDALGGFDNSEFIGELEDRGFYVASEATSNYLYSLQSLASSLNMAYLDDLGERTPGSRSDLLRIGRENALVAILKNLGYFYVHLESGFVLGDEAPSADLELKFTPAGVLRNSNGGLDDESPVDLHFARSLIATTVLGAIAGETFLRDDHSALPWYARQRTLQMFDVLSHEIEGSSPKFVFAHIVKPHRPATFDQHGNFVSGATMEVLGVKAHDEFGPAHDPSVPDAYIGQLIYINSLVLDTVDNILSHSDNDPIIVIAADHGRADDSPGHAILAAFHLPRSGTANLYPSISSVNHFRYILDYYFDLDIGLVEDVQFHHEFEQYDFRDASPEPRG